MSGIAGLSRADWVVDWAVIGLITAVTVPLVATGIFAQPLLATPFVVVCGALGVPSGALVGAGLWALHQRLHPRSYRALGLLLLPPALGLWGAAVASASAAISIDADSVVIAWLMGTVAATLQMVWLVPSYPWWARDAGRRQGLRFLVLPFASASIGVMTPLLSLPMAFSGMP